MSDAAQAHGARYKTLPIAKLADITCFSFYPGKNLGAYGDGGALATDDEVRAHEARKFANHGRSKKYDHDFEGVNSRLDGLQAAVLGVKLRYLDHWTDRRRSNAYSYNAALEDVGVVTPVETENVRSVYHLYVVRVLAEQRERFQASLKASGVATGIHYPIALPYLKAYRYLGYTEADFPEALRASSEIVSLPMFAELNESQVAYVTQQIARFASQDHG